MSEEGLVSLVSATGVLLSVLRSSGTEGSAVDSVVCCSWHIIQLREERGFSNVHLEQIHLSRPSRRPPANIRFRQIQNDMCVCVCVCVCCVKCLNHHWVGLQVLLKVWNELVEFPFSNPKQVDTAHSLPLRCNESVTGSSCVKKKRTRTAE